MTLRRPDHPQIIAARAAVREILKDLPPKCAAYTGKHQLNLCTREAAPGSAFCPRHTPEVAL